nr:MAG: hypothetical protein DIU78_23935 [Pseudomonadota bacterium]
MLPAPVPKRAGLRVPGRSHQDQAGRLVVAAVLGAIAASQYYSPPLYVGLIVLAFLATPWAVVRGMAFNARNTSFRNVRFAFTGNVGEAAALYFGMLALYFLTCGCAYPYAHYRFTDFIVSRHRYGSEPFTFYSAKMGDYYRVYLAVLAMSVPAYFFLLVPLLLSDHVGGQEALMLMVPGLVAFYLLLFVPAAYFQSRLANLLYGNMRIGLHSFSCRQRARDLFVLYVTNALAVLFSAGLLIPWAKVRLARYRAQCLTLHAEGSLDVAAEHGAEGSVFGDAATDLGDFDLGIGA